jgi:hypothetical protein
MGHLWDIHGTFVTFFQNKDVFTGDFLQHIDFSPLIVSTNGTIMGHL